MNLRAAVMVATLLLGPSAHAFDAWLTASLHVVTEQVPEAVAVDGVIFTIQRATGADVPELARRIESQWRGQGSEVRPLRQDDWNIRTRMRGAFSEVVQWRMNNEEHELLWSTFHADAAPTAVPEAGLVLPAQCIWGRSVHGSSARHSYLQRSARCAMPADVLRAAIQGSLAGQGWHARTGTDSGILLDRPDAEGFLSLTPLQDKASTWLVWLRVQQRKGKP